MSKQKIASAAPATPEDITPYDNNLSKGEQIEAMFDHIAPAYDFMNSAMSLGQHKRWRRIALDMALHNNPHPEEILDVATGTGDVAFALASKLPASRITGIDLSGGMLAIANQRLSQLPESTQRRLSFCKGDSLDLPFADDSFDLVTVAYGVRNFQNLRRGLEEICRVMRPGATLCIIELSRPEGSLPLIGYKIYTRLIPVAGRLIAGDSEAYRYLPESIAACPQRDEMTDLLLKAGFREATWRQLTLGTLCIYIAKK